MHCEYNKIRVKINRTSHETKKHKEWPMQWILGLAMKTSAQRFHPTDSEVT